MGKAAEPVDAPAPRPAPIAGFVMTLSPREGGVASAVALENLRPLAAEQCVFLGWPVQIPVGRGGNRTCVPLAAVAPSAGTGGGLRSAIWPRATKVGSRAPRFAVAPDTGFQRLREVAALLSGEPAAAAPSPQAVPVTSLVVASAAMETVEAPLTLPQFTVAAQEDLEGLRDTAALRASSPAGLAPSPRAVPVTSLVVASAAVETVEAPLTLPQFTVAAQEDLERLRETVALRAGSPAGPAPSPQPQPAARLVAATAALEAAAGACPVALPAFLGVTSIAALARRTRPATLVEMGGSQRHSGEAEQPRAGAALLPFKQREQLPQFSVAACFESPDAHMGGIPRLVASDEWMPSANPAVTARMALPSMAGTMAPRAAARATFSATQPCPPAVRPQLPACDSFRPALRPQPVSANAVASTFAVAALPRAVRLPAMPAWEAKDSLGGAHASRAEAPTAKPVESFPAVEPCTLVPALDLPPLSCPVPAVAAVGGRARLDCVALPDRRMLPAPRVPVAARMAAPKIAGARFKTRISAGKAFPVPSRKLTASLRPAPFAALDFHCRPKPGVVSGQVTWTEPAIAVLVPRLGVRPFFERWEDLAPAAGTKSGLKKVAVMPRSVRQFADSKRTRHTIGVVAAGLFLGAAIWYAAGGGNARNAREAGTVVAVNENPAAALAVRQQPKGPVEKVRHAIAERAAVSWSDSFRGGMAAWGVASNSVAPGWTRSADGYVQPGSLAIFHPTLNYTDYTLEFFGQIERQSIDWVVRARDSQNYYAMKVMVVRPGLRPLVALAHYAVVNGKKAAYMETPLDIMVHNSRPMQVMVDVKGNHFTASVDGEQVGSWSDEVSPTGGVGFFAEAGEKTRLYWMRVSRNQDFLGRICAYVAGSQSLQTAGLWSADPYGRPRQDQGGPDRPVESAGALGIAAMATVRRSRRRSRAFLAGPYFVERRIETWSP